MSVIEPYDEKPFHEPLKNSDLDSAIVAIRTDNGSEPLQLLADFGSHPQTIATQDKESLDLYEDLKASILSTGLRLHPTSPSAASYAICHESRHVKPRVFRWAHEGKSTGDRFRLPQPVEKLLNPLGEVFSQRRSSDIFSRMSTFDLSSLLFHASRVRHGWVGPDGYPCTSRPAPSAGARHPIDIMVISSSIEGPSSDRFKPNSPMLFDPYTCDMIDVSSEYGDCFRMTSDLLHDLIGCVPPVVLAMIAKPSRTLSRYRGGLSLVYRDAGAMISTIVLVATALGLTVRPLAIVIPPELSGSLPSDFLDVGGIALGGCIAKHDS